MHTQKSNFSLILSLCTYITLMPTYGYTQQEPAQDPMLQQAEKEALELNARYQQVFADAFKLKNMLIQISSTISNIPDGIISNKKNAHNFIKNWHLVIDARMDDVTRTAQAQEFDYLAGTLNVLIDTCVTCSTDVCSAMKKNFLDANCSYEVLPVRTILLSFDALDEQIKLFEAVFKTLAENAQCIGITFKNKVIRKIDDALSWCSRNHVGKVVALTSGVSALALYWFWHECCPQSCNYEIANGNPIKAPENNPAIGIPGSAIVDGLKDADGNLVTFEGSDKIVWAGLGNSWSDLLVKKVTGLLGMPPARHTDGTFSILDTDKGYINSLDATINNGLAQKFPPLFYIPGGMLLAKASDIVYNTVMPPLKKLFDAKWNQWRGGAYTDKPVADVFEFYPHSTFDDVIGMDDYKARFAVLLNYCVHPEQFTQAGNKPTTGYAFTGPTRTGKTFMAYALCGEIQKILDLNGSTTQFRYLNIPGEIAATSRISGIMNYARSIAPCVIFIDEFDLCGAQRSGDRGFVMDALSELGDPRKNDPLKPIITIIATNRAHNIDTALFTPGRLGEEIRFDYPCIEDRVSFIEHTINRAGITSELDFIRLAQKVNGQSFEAMDRFIASARSKALILNTSITQQLLERSIDEEIRRIIFFDRKHLPKKEALLLSAHFAGETLATMLLQDTNVLDMVTINAYMPKVLEEVNSGTGRESSWQPKVLVGKTFTRPILDTFGLLDRQQIINRIKCLLAGAAAEEIILGYPSSNLCDQDAAYGAYEWAKQLTFAGRYKTQMADAVHDKLSLEADKLFTQCAKEVKELLEEHREQLDALVHALMTYKTLADYDVAMIMEKPSIVYQTENEAQA